MKYSSTMLKLSNGFWMITTALFLTKSLASEAPRKWKIWKIVCVCVCSRMGVCLIFACWPRWMLFIIHMNDIHEVSRDFHAILYADDTSPYSSLGSFNVNLNGNNYDKNTLSIKINNELSNIQQWLNINKLSLNVNKTKYTIFHNYQRNINSYTLDVKINN